MTPYVLGLWLVLVGGDSLIDPWHETEESRAELVDPWQEVPSKRLVDPWDEANSD